MPRTACEPSNYFASRPAGPPRPELSQVATRQPFTSAANVAHVGDEPVDVGLVVLHGEQPLLHLAPWRQEDAAVVLHQPVQMAQPLVDVEEVAEVAHRPVEEADAALGPGGHDRATGGRVSRSTRVTATRASGPGARRCGHTPRA